MYIQKYIKSVLGRVCITSFSLVLHHGRFEYKEGGIYHIKSVVGRVCKYIQLYGSYVVTE